MYSLFSCLTSILRIFVNECYDAGDRLLVILTKRMILSSPIHGLIVVKNNSNAFTVDLKECLGHKIARLVKQESS